MKIGNGDNSRENRPISGWLVDRSAITVEEYNDLLEVCRINRKLQTTGDAHLWKRMERLSEQIERLERER
jgi:hypothetical protein